MSAKAFPFPILETAAQQFENNANTTTSGSTQLTGNASANTKMTSYTTLVSSTAFASFGILLAIGDSGSGDYLIDIAIGAASSEVNLISNLLWSRQLGSGGRTYSVFIPIYVPAGVRLSARHQSSTGSNNLDIQATLCGTKGLFPLPFKKVTSYGPATGDSGAVSIDPGGTINTKPATWTQIVAATTDEIHWLIISIGNQANATRTGASWLLDIGVGGAGAEVVKIPNLRLSAGTGADEMNPQYYSVPCYIPSGSRIAANAQCSINDATDRLFDLALYGCTGQGRGFG